MGSNDNNVLHAIGEVTYGVPPQPRKQAFTGFSVTSGVISFLGVSNATDFKAGQSIAVADCGFALANGYYVVKANGTGTTVTADLPAGKGTIVTGDTAAGTLGNHIKLRFDSEDLGLTPGRGESPEVTGSTGVANLREDTRSASGTTPFQFLLPAIGERIRRAAFSPWTYSGASGELASVGTSISITTGGTKIVKGTAWGSAVSAGDWVRIYSTDANYVNRGRAARVVSKDVVSGELVVDYCTLTDHGGNTTLRVVKADMLENGSTKFPETIERIYTDEDVANAGAPRFPGALINTMQVGGDAGSTLTGQIAYMIADEVSPTPVTFLADELGSTGDAQRADLPSSDDVTAGYSEVWIDGTDGGCSKRSSWQFNNNLDPNYCWGSEALKGIDKRRLNVTGDFTRRYASKTRHDVFLSNANEPLVYKHGTAKKHATGPLYIVQFKAVQYTAANRGTQGANTSSESSYSWTAINQGSGWTYRVFRWEA